MKLTVEDLRKIIFEDVYMQVCFTEKDSYYSLKKAKKKKKKKKKNHY